MKKLIIEIRKVNLEELFNEMEEKGMLRKIQAKVFKRIYRGRLNGLLKIVKRNIKDWIVIDTEDLISSEEEGEDSYILAEEGKLNAFFNGKEDLLKNNKEYHQFKNDRIVHKVLSAMRQRLSKAKDTAISLALGSSTVMEFFNKAGINVVVRVE